MSRLARQSPRPGPRAAVLAGALAGGLTAVLVAVAGGDGPPGEPETAVAGSVADRAPADAERLVSRDGDRWSSAYSAEEYEALRLSLQGEYVGTGIAVRRTGDGHTEVSRVQPGSPAEAAGVRPGDRLREVDGAPADDRPVTEVAGGLRGTDDASPARPGSAVAVGLERDGERWETELRRARLTADPVTVDREVPGATRVVVDRFPAGTARELAAALAELPPDEGVILDLRGNSGGLLSEAADAAAVFLDGGLVATYDVHGAQQALHAARGGDTSRPLVVLVDGGTMSSAELMAGALQDRNRAVVVGRATFGKGTVQVPSEQPDGSVAELTVGRYATPSGATVEEGRGIVPDLVPPPGEDVGCTAVGVLRGLAQPARG